jgi:hypothetical protein
MEKFTSMTEELDKSHQVYWVFFKLCYNLERSVPV